MEKIIEALINKVYYAYRRKHYEIIFLHSSSLDKYLSEPLIKFSGFELNYDWYGFSRHSERSCLGSSKIYEHTIYLNQWFLNLLMGNEDIPVDFTFAKLVETIAHEVAHCLVFDFYPQISEKHEIHHSIITQKLEEVLKNDVLTTKLQAELLELPNRK